MSVGTATFGNPAAAMVIKQELEEICIQRGFVNFRDAIGFAHRAEGGDGE